jgi:asparagine synthase (glutamine-hydrolysing)
MCGICGVVQIGGEPRDVLPLELLDRMRDVMTHRGPNDCGTHVEPGVALAVRRLSVVDVEGGHQPFSNEEDSVWAIQNGELYNHAALRRELCADGHTFRTLCDTEVLPHLYERDGDAFTDRLRGMFGLAIWDSRKRRTVVARDRLGIKPVYYAEVGDLLVFASELKGVLASGLVGPELDFEAIDVYLAFGFFPAPRTPLAGVRKLMPGHRLVVDERGIQLERYWAYPAPASAQSIVPLAEYKDRLIAELDTSVRLRLMSDVPLGAMLSGGLDSSLIVALMARNMAEPVKTFSVGFVEDRRGNELADARYVANVFGTDHHELELSFTHDTIDLADLVWHLDEPIADLSAIGFYGVSELAARYVTVALSGQGADELFGGYRKHQAASLANEWRRLPAPLARAAVAAALRGPARFRRPARTLAAHDGAERQLAMSGRVDSALRARLFRGPLAELDGEAPRRAVSALTAGVPDDPLPMTLFIDGQLALVDDMLHYFDRTSMAHSLEVRVPFLDHHFVEFCAHIPSGLKVRRLNRKFLLKEAARGIIPDRIIDKPKLGFFRHATTAWLRAQLEGAAGDYLLDGRGRCSEFLDRALVQRLITGQGRDDRGDGQLVLAILMLEIWLQTYLPRARRAPAAAIAAR